MNIPHFLESIHKGQKRKTGENYTSHLYAVRDILAEEGVCEKTILNSALLHDVLEDGGISKEYLSFRFGEKVSAIVEAVSKDTSWNTAYCKTKSYLDSIESSLAEHPESVLIKMADRLHNLRTIDGFSLKKKKEYLNETKECFIPLFEAVIRDTKIGTLKKALESLLKKLRNEVRLIEYRLSV